MTQDGHEPDPNDAPPRPTSTHWAEPDVHDDAGLLPPFVPGRSRADHDDEVLGTDDAVVDTTGAVSEAADTVLEAAKTNQVSTPGADEPAEEVPISFHDWPAGYAAGEPPEMEAEVSQAHAPQEDRPTEPPRTRQEDDPEAALADRLEELAHRIRTEGRTGIESEMASLDRFTALVAGVVAGYLAGMGD
jgi:hypothetical protein